MVGLGTKWWVKSIAIHVCHTCTCMYSDGRVT